MRRDAGSASAGASADDDARGMQVLVNSDHTIVGGASMAGRIRSDIELALQRVSDRITRVEVHLSDENGAKGGRDDKRCMLEARLEGRQPIAVTSHAATIDIAVHDAAMKLMRVIDSTEGRAEDARRG